MDNQKDDSGKKTDESLGHRRRPLVELPTINVVPLADQEEEESTQNNNEKPTDADERDALLRHSSGDSGGVSERRLRRVESQTSNEPMSPAEKVRFILTDVDQNEPTENVVLDGHALFCQMDVLCHFDEGEMGWKESARWLKYEEKVEAGERWSKPHVPTAALHALFEIRNCIADNTATVLLDMDSSHGCIHQVAEHITRVIVKEKNLPTAIGQQILDVILKPHKHKHRKGRAKQHDHPASDKTGPTHGEGCDENCGKRPASGTENGTENADQTSPEKADTGIEMKPRKRHESQQVSALHHTYPGGIHPDELVPHKPNKRLMGKIPGGSEVANIMVGHVDFLIEPIMVLVRLGKSAVLADLTEVALPTRFLLILLGPPESKSIWEYEEVGRAAATLFTDRVFCEVAYKAETSQDIVDGIDEYIDDLTVLPPSIWDPTTRLAPPEQTMTMDKIRKRLVDSARRAAAEEAFHFTESAGHDDTLQRTGRFFGGLIKDMKRRYPLYVSDFKDAFHMQCFASVIFLYFACVTPIVTFGGMMGHATDGYMGTMESLLSGALCGIVYHLLAGQPLTIMGATGPLLVFETILYQVCKGNGVDFMSFRVWVGLWVFCVLIIIVAFDLSALVRYITRFTEESFAVLISIIFIFESFKKLGDVWKTHPIHIYADSEEKNYTCHCQHPSINVSLTGGMDSKNPYGHLNLAPQPDQWTINIYEDCITHLDRIIVRTGCISESDCRNHNWTLVGDACNVSTVTHSVPDVFFFCCFLFIGTFVIAIFFRNLRNRPYFSSIVRSTLSDFAVLMAILICSTIDMFLQLDTPKLMVPEKFETTRPDRGWLVDPFQITHIWLIAVAIVPALLATILIFLDQQITAVIVNRKEHKLKKGHGYHLDLFVLAFLIATCSLLGLPWFVAATVRTITHVRSLIKESELRAPGERPQFLGVREQRLTGVCIHILIGSSVFLTPVLKHVPMAVLYGVFLYMGVTSLGGVQFVQRILILFMPQKSQPDYVFLRHVETKRVHVFTVMQIVCMLFMWVVKSIKMISILFPILLLLLCFIRKGMDFIFTQRELFWLDHILPEEKRRDAEDEALEKGVEVHYDVKGDRGDEEDGEIPPEGDEWDALTDKRDYGVGRKLRPRQLSKDVIKRYQKSKPSPLPDTIAEEHDGADTPPFIESFRERQFSL